MHPKTRHAKLLEIKKVSRWYENLRARSQVTAVTYLRNFGLWLEYLEKDPESLIEFARNDFDEFKGSVSDKIRDLEKKGIAGSSISTSIKPMISYLKFNNVVVRLSINIRNENRNFNAEKEITPDKDKLAAVFRHSSARERVSIALMAFSGLRPEVMGNIDGTDGLRLSDIPDLVISREKVEVQKVPLQIVVRPELSKIRQQYFTFLGDEGSKYLQEYLENRIRKGQSLDSDDPVILPDAEMQRNPKTNVFLTTTLLLRRIKAFIVKSGFDWRPYIFRVYFGTNLDTAESKGLISHPWRQFIMGHKGDIEETYTKRSGMVDEGRESYTKCLPYLQTESKGLTPEQNEAMKSFKRIFLKSFDFTDQEVEDMINWSDADIANKIEERKGKRAFNGHKQKVIDQSEVKHYIEDLGWEFVKDLNDGEAIVKFPQP